MWRITSKTLQLYASATGNSNIAICENDGHCASLPIIVTNSGVVQNSNSVQQSSSISSFSVSSNSINGKFIDAGNILTFTFNTNGSIQNISVSVNGTALGVSGSGSGPYTATYTLVGNEKFPLPVIVNFVNNLGSSGQIVFSLGNQLSSASNTSMTSNNLSNGSGVFSSFLTLNSSGTEVIELQKKLKSLGFFTSSITGYFGKQTQSAVKKFQKAHNLLQVGYVGPSTRVALNK